MNAKEKSSASFSIIASFEHLFTHQHCEEDIRSVVCAIKESRPIAPLLHTAKGSFSTIFLPFHIGKADVHSLATRRPRFRAFCALSGAIESLTDTMSLEGEEPAEHQKRELLPLLVEFLSMLPDKETFCFWLHEN